VALALRAAALDAMPVLWDAVSVDESAGWCALRYQTGRIVALVPVGATPGGANAPVSLLLEGWHDGVSIRVGPVSAGRSATHAGVPGVRQALREAERALALGERLRGPGYLTAYAEVFALDYASYLMADARLMHVYEQVPARLGAFDQSEGTQLVATLERYLGSGCSMQRTATGMGIHRNTVLYRVKRIEEIAGVDLADDEVRFFIQLALRARRRLQSSA
jgi:DNA-binding CsgD family transcriptional regulator